MARATTTARVCGHAGDMGMASGESGSWLLQRAQGAVQALCAAAKGAETGEGPRFDCGKHGITAADAGILRRQGEASLRWVARQTDLHENQLPPMAKFELARSLCSQNDFERAVILCQDCLGHRKFDFDKPLRRDVLALLKQMLDGPAEAQAAADQMMERVTDDIARESATEAPDDYESPAGSPG
mmetsp:Transcript_37811/g.88389  ORF Transcript_37811/g.88389 Transcript_37811/m.88389 type:complete len:185 (+) Transcript_37811:567-1121(+)